jgi:hypothetical protein
MSTYLVVSHSYEPGSELHRALERTEAEDRYADFVLLAPAAAPGAFVNGGVPRARDFARRNARETAAALRRAGFAVKWTVVSDEAPVVALQTELRDHPGLYAGLIVVTPARERSRWRDFYLLRAAEAFGLPLVHVVEDEVAPVLLEAAV